MNWIPAQTPPWIEPWELPAYYRRLKAAVLELENAWEEGSLDQALEDGELTRAVGPRVADSYRRLLEREAPRRIPFRRDSIHALLEPLKELLADPAHLFPARVPPPEAVPTALPAATPEGTGVVEMERSPGRIQSVIARGPAGDVLLRLHHVVGSRFWGIGFSFEDVEHERWYVNTLVRLALRRLAADLDGLQTVERWLRRRPRLKASARIVPDHDGRRFEQLMMDILNEDAYIARRAALSEDFLEKTDLRVRPPGLERRRGARVQVTQTIHREHLARKLARIRRLNEFIILSPRSLADALSGEEAEELLNRAELRALWDCLAFVPATVEDLAVLLKERLLNTYALSGEDPRGPLAEVPRVLRDLIRRYVTRESFRSTRELRDREARSGQ